MPQLSDKEAEDVVGKLADYLGELKSRWDLENPGNHSWFSFTDTYLHTATRFLVGITDELVLFIEALIPASPGSDKKAAVLAVIGKIYDYIVVVAFPIWLKPFWFPIKVIIVYIAISDLIDFIVDKYNAGYWQTQQEATNGKAYKAKKLRV